MIILCARYAEKQFGFTMCALIVTGKITVMSRSTAAQTK